jgi:hypothetical protein
MYKIINSFSTRETSLVIWLTLFILFCLFNKSLRKSIGNVLMILFSGKILLSLIAYLIHTSIYIFLLYKYKLWDISLLKDTIFWTLGFGFVAMMNVNKVNNNAYFKNLFFDAIKWTIAIEFIVNFFTFSLIKELIILPPVVFSAMMQAFASFEKNHKQVENLFKNLLMYFSFFIFFFSLYMTYEQYNELFTTDNFKSFILPVILSITFLPFMYLYNLLLKYESLWMYIPVKGGHPFLFKGGQLGLLFFE